MDTDDFMTFMFTLVFLIAVTIINVSACQKVALNTQQPPEQTTIIESGNIEIVEVDGLTCAVFQAYNEGGISCDWDSWDR